MSDHAPNVLGSNVNPPPVTTTETPTPALFSPEYPPGEPRCRTRAHECVSSATAGSIIPHQWEAQAEEVRRLRGRVAALEVVLRMVQAGGLNGSCPCCGGFPEHSDHNPGCAVAAALRG